MGAACGRPRNKNNNNSSRNVGCFRIFRARSGNSERDVRVLREPWVNPLAKLSRSGSTLLLGLKLQFAASRLKRKLAKIKDLDEDDEQERWDELHRRNAKLVLEHIYKYRGFFSKIGQSMSAKKGHLPAPWVETLEPLQNEMPFTQFSTVRKTVRRSLGRELEDIFEDFTEKPVASASVAQAHVARQRSTGEKVCVKVQHPGVVALMNTDLITISILLWLMKKFNSDAPDLTEIIKEWRRTAKEEVDFLLEAKNASDACRSLRTRGLTAGSCEPLPELCAREVLTMRFEEGWKITDVSRFPPGADRDAVGSQLLEAFASLTFEEGLIHGDPHPGNIFVQPCRSPSASASTVAVASAGATDITAGVSAAASADGVDVAEAPIRQEWVTTGSSETPSLRAVLLDWGIVRRLQPSERVSLARWVVASLSRDHMLYATALRELGFHFSEELSGARLDEFMQGGMLLLRDTIPSGAMRQFVRQRGQIERRERERSKKAAKGGKDAPAAFKFSGTVLYFFRGLQLVHDCCGALEVSVPVASIMLKYALTLLGSATTLPRVVPALGDASRADASFTQRDSSLKCARVDDGRRAQLEAAIMGKLRELEADKKVLGAQVAVLRAPRCVADAGASLSGASSSTSAATASSESSDSSKVGCASDEACAADWLCHVAFGRAGVLGGELSTQTLLPLLDVGTGVLIACLLAALGRSEASAGSGARKAPTLESFVEELWPEFSQRGKSGVTISQLLQHRAGLTRPFPGKLRCKQYCDERRMETAVAACPPELDSDDSLSVGLCPVVGVAAAALLRRVTGHGSVPEALRAILTPLALQDDIVYSGDDQRMAFVGHPLLEEVTMATMWSILEGREKREEYAAAMEGKEPPKWLSGEELAEKDPWCADPLIVNGADLRSGKACAAGTGLRASAGALCQLYATDSGFIPARVLEQGRSLATRVSVASVRDWETMGGCIEVSTCGWQIFRFKHVDSGADVFGYGHMNSSTGSIALRLPSVSIAVLLTCVDDDAVQVGRELLNVVAAQLGLQPCWPEQPDADLLERSARRNQKTGEDDLVPSLRKLELEVSRLTTALADAGYLSFSATSAVQLDQGPCISGKWVSGEVTGLDEFFEIMNVPMIARAMAKKMQRRLNIELPDGQVKISTSTSIARRQVEQSETTFRVGEPFQGNMFMRVAYQGLARWTGPVGSGPLFVEKRFTVAERDVVVEDTYTALPDGRLKLETCFKGRGEVEASIQSKVDIHLITKSMDPTSHKLKGDLTINGQTFHRGGRIVRIRSTGANDAFPVESLANVTPPVSVYIQYADVSSVMYFDLEGGSRRGQSMTAATSSFAFSSHQRPTTFNTGTVEQILIEGVAWKRSRYLMQWRKRRVILTASALKCLKDNGSCTESISVGSIDRVSRADDVLPNCLCVKSGLRKYMFAFADLRERAKWSSEIARLSGASVA